MNLKSHLSLKLSKMLFLEVNSERLKEIFKVNLNTKIYMPLKSDYIVNDVKSQENIDTIPVAYFIEGMYFVMGADPEFRFNEVYIELLSNAPDSIKFIKGKIYEYVEEKNYEEAYLNLKGLLNLENTEENFDKLLMLIDKLRNLDKMYKEEELDIISKYKEQYDKASMPYLYEGIIKKEKNDFAGALFCVNNYLARGGEETLDITELKMNLKSIVNYERGKEILDENPEEALKLLLPLKKDFEDDAILYYYIAVAYRMLKNYEKAIYYLNESVSIDSSIVETINEMGINYASLGDFNKAIAYLRKAFEVTKSVEICTNLIMCYLNAGKVEDARKHYNIAKKLKPKDEIVMELEKIFDKEK